MARCQTEGCGGEAVVYQRNDRRIVGKYCRACSARQRKEGWEQAGHRGERAKQLLSRRLGRPLHAWERAVVGAVNPATGKRPVVLFLRGDARDITCPHCGRVYEEG